MKYLGIDTSGNHLTVTVFDGIKYYDYFEENSLLKHSLTLMPKVEELLNKANLILSDLDFIACVVGAGSFTGIRIGVSTVKGLAIASKIKFLSITSFDTIAYNRKDGKTLAVIDAGHGGYYIAGYESKRVVLEPKYALFDQVKRLEKDYVFLSGGKVEGFNTEKVDLLNGLKKAIEEKIGDISGDYNLLTPLYLRKSQAEEGRP